MKKHVHWLAISLVYLVWTLHKIMPVDMKSIFEIVDICEITWVKYKQYIDGLVG